MSPLGLLIRRDRWTLGGGGALLWAPRFPRWLDRPGLWDPAQFYHAPFGPLFALTLLDEAGRPLPPELRRRTWTPDTLVLQHRLPGGLRLAERRCWTPGDLLVCDFHLSVASEMRPSLDLLLWGCVPARGESGTDLLRCHLHEGRLHLLFRGGGRRGTRIPFEVTLGWDLEPAGGILHVLSHGPSGPHWGETPLADQFPRPRLLGDTNAGAKVPPAEYEMRPGTVLLWALHARGDLAPDRGIDCRAFCHAAPSRPVGRDGPAWSGAPAEVRGAARAARRQAWEAYLGSVPQLRCSSERLERAYWYRWSLLRLNRFPACPRRLPAPGVAEGWGPFRMAISYSAPAQMMEARWMLTPDLARGILLNFLRRQRRTGALPGFVYATGSPAAPFYHADWGGALLAIERVHPSRDFAALAYEGLARYARHFDRERDREGSGLYDIVNQLETGQEFSPRYTAVDPAADAKGWGEHFRLKGVDVTVYLYRLKMALGEVAEALGRGREADRWREEAGAVARAVREAMWDPQEACFSDVDPRGWKRTGVRAAVCFYPYMTDMVGPEHLAGLKRLYDPSEFWGPFPVTSLSRRDAQYSADGEWKGVRMPCPWNGRVWPMLCCHIADALGTVAERFGDAEARGRCAELLLRLLTMMSYEGDPRRPNAFEHYHPDTGRPSLYRGIDDYQHSWVLDLILRYAAGVRPAPGGRVRIDPLALGLDWLEVRGIPFRGHRLDVDCAGEEVRVSWDGREVARTGLGIPVLLDESGRASP